MTWLRADRTELAAGRILDAAGRLFAERGVGAPGMDEIARAAGCSRATLYRYFENRHALVHAFARREAVEITAEVGRDIPASDDLRTSAVEAVLACVAAVRARPYLRAWYAEDSSVLAEVLRESAPIRTLAEAWVSPVEPDDDLTDWLLRIVLSFLTQPGADPAQERRLLVRFLVLPPR